MALWDLFQLNRPQQWRYLFPLLLLFLCVDAHAAVWYVNDTSTAGDSFTTAHGYDTQPGTASAPFRSPGKAMDSVAAGDTILVDAGIYSRMDTVTAFSETAVINIDKDSISLIGKDSNSVVFVPPGVIGSSGRYAIYASGRRGLLVKNIGVTGAWGGIFFNNVDLSAITNDSACGNDSVGILLTGGSDSNSVSGNTANANRLDGIAITGNSINNVLIGNSASSNVFGIEMDGSFRNIAINNAINSNIRAGILIDAADSNVFMQNDISGNDTGVWISDTSINNTITKNNIGRNNVNNIYNDKGRTNAITRNWWGTTDEVAISAKYADTVNVYRPYRLSVVDTAAGADTTAPGLPAGVTTDTTTPGQITVKWTIPTINEETHGGTVGYAGSKIYRLTNTADTSNWANAANLVKTTGPADTSWTDVNVVGGNRYFYRLTSIDAAGFINQSFFSDTVWSLADTAPSTASAAATVKYPSTCLVGGLAFHNTKALERFRYVRDRFLAVPLGRRLCGIYYYYFLKSPAQTLIN